MIKADEIDLSLDAKKGKATVIKVSTNPDPKTKVI